MMFQQRCFTIRSPQRHKQLVMICFCVLLGVGPLQSRSVGDDAVHVDWGDAGMVVSDSAVASRIGRDMLIQGGSAVDAAVATAFALAVSWPDAGNIGGGGFMIVRPANGKDPICIDYREVAPLAMTATSYTDEDTTYSQKAVGVPGTVRGLAKAHQLHGKLPWKSVVMPAAQLAAEGVPVDLPLSLSLNKILRLEEVSKDEKYAALRRAYANPDGGIWSPGDVLVLPDLARTLTEIAENGPDAFYTGRIADLIVQEMERGDGMITHEDLSRYSAKVRPAMRGTYRGYTIIGAPPPSSGGTCIIEALNILENFDLGSRERSDPRNVHLITESLRRVFADRARHLGDPDFVEIPQHLTSKEYAKELSEDISLSKASKSEQIAPEIKLSSESPDTTHFSVVDGDGMAVSNTYTLEASWGSRIVVRGAGFVLNNEMGDFNWFPGTTTRKGRIGTDANLIAPGKRMLSSQTPTIVEQDGRVVLVTGSPGGRTIISTVLCILVNVIDFAMDPADAVAASRLHHQWFPDRIQLEDSDRPPNAELARALRAMGHRIENRTSQGSAHTIAVATDGTLIGVADYRRGGRPAAITRGTIGVWDFGDPAGTNFSLTGHIGNYQWSDDIAGSVTNGHDQFHIRRDSPVQPMRAYLDLRDAELKRVSAEIKIDSAKFAGWKPNEQIRLSFTHGTIIPRITARMVFGRTEQNKIVLHGEASSRGTPIAPTVLSETPAIDQPIVLRLEVDTDANTYRIASRQASETDFTYHGTGNVARDREVNYLSFNALNDYASEGEYVDIDRIEVTTE